MEDVPDQDSAKNLATKFKLDFAYLTNSVLKASRAGIEVGSDPPTSALGNCPRDLYGLWPE